MIKVNFGPQTLALTKVQLLIRYSKNVCKAHTASVIASTSEPLIIRIVQIAFASGVGKQSNAIDSIKS